MDGSVFRNAKAADAFTVLLRDEIEAEKQSPEVTVIDARHNTSKAD